jgi:hypothetical protein
MFLWGQRALNIEHNINIVIQPVILQYVYEVSILKRDMLLASR